MPKILLDVLTHHITVNKVFQNSFGRKPWDGGQNDREWLASVMKKKPRVPKFSCEEVRKKPTSEWDATILVVVLLAVMEPSDDPLPEVEHIVKVRQSRNALYHRSKTEVSGDEFSQCVMSVQRLIEQALRPYFPKERSEGYLAELDRAACSEFLYLHGI